MTWGLKPVGVQEPIEARRAVRPAAPARFRLLRGWRWQLLGGVLLLAALIATRAPLAPRHLVTFDDINFALSIRDFSPGAHQPQPPGYPLYVGLLKLLALGIPKIETVFLVSALLLSLASLVLLWMVGGQMMGARWGFIAALLLLWNPPFWYGALTNPVRLGLSAGSAGVALCLLLAVRRRSDRWFIAAAAVLGLAAGFRPTLLVEMAPLVLWTAWSLRLKRKTALLALGAFALVVATWLPVLIAVTGGLESFYRLLIGYSGDTTRGTSLLGGARLAAAFHMAAEAIVWSCLGVLTWIWAVPWAARGNSNLLRETLGNPFLMLWFLPSFLMSAIFHVGDPDQTLTIVPVTCLIGARVLASFDRKISFRACAVMVAVAVSLNALQFFKPISKLAKASSYKSIVLQERYIDGLVDRAGAISNPGGVTIIFPPGIPGWRNTSYYLPDSRTLVVGQVSHGARTVFRVHDARGQVSSTTTGVLRISSCGVIALADPVERPSDASGKPVQISRAGTFWLFTAVPGLSLRSRGVRFIAADEPCGSSGAPATIADAVAPSPAETIVNAIPHLAVGNNFTTAFYVVNSADQPAKFSMSFYDDRGKPLRIPFADGSAVSTIADIVPGNGSRYFEAGNPRSRTLIAGSAVVRENPSITIQALVRHYASGNIFYEAAIPASSGALETQIAFDETIFPPTGAQISTGIAIANLDTNEAATVVCTARNRSGNVIPDAVKVPVLQPLGHWAGIGFPALSGLQGTLECTSNTKIGAIALRSMPNGAISSLPVITK